MTFSNAPSEIQAQESKNQILTLEAQNRVSHVVRQINQLLKENGDIQTVIQSSLDGIVTGNLRDPEKTRTIIKGLYEGRDERLKPEQLEEAKTTRLDVLKQFSQFMEGLTQNLAHMHRDINLGNEMRSLTESTQSKIYQTKETYAGIVQNEHPTKTA